MISVSTQRKLDPLCGNVGERRGSSVPTYFDIFCHQADASVSTVQRGIVTAPFPCRCVTREIAEVDGSV